ncbi:uncharacterized protein F5147DRAFT_652504 [Suillus discolor]|uniref:Uncharacterized protein n=1 Tax=Suillus discolor TaxID=1912936 RepID=A0A9P7F6N0_9AGAM|nr:uncharacterized protein F5147DRAFT_652504 [Suillus discolor]KAG2108908.1 hypothetical protein F5147DRAFT_652504 [Suillus discolor]
MREVRECVRVYAETRESKNFNYALLGSKWVLLWFSPLSFWWESKWFPVGDMAPKHCHAEPKRYRVRYVKIYGTWWTVDGCFRMAGAIGRSSAGKLARIYIMKHGKLRAHCAMRGKAAPHVGIAVGSIQSDATSMSLYSDMRWMEATRLSGMITQFLEILHELEVSCLECWGRGHRQSEPWLKRKVEAQDSGEQL